MLNSGNEPIPEHRVDPGEGRRIAIVHDQLLMRECLRAVLEHSGFEVVAEVDSVAAGPLGVGDARPDLVLMELRPAGAAGAEDGLAALRALRQADPAPRVLVISSLTDRHTGESCLREGASGFLAEQRASGEELVNALRGVLRGERVILLPEQGHGPGEDGIGRSVLDELTGREREVLTYVAAGADNLKIASHLRISERTVKSHVSSLYIKLEAENRAELALAARRLGVKPPRDG